jgi:hypothetical protein
MVQFARRALFALVALPALALATACSSTSPVTTAPMDAAADVAATDGGGCDAAMGVGSRQVTLPTPSGAFGIARGARRSLVDPSRVNASPDVFDAGLDASGEPRRLSVEVWYPTDPCAPGDPAPYLDDVEGAGSPPDGWKSVRTHSVSKAAFAKDAGARPLLLFSPAYSALPRTYTAFFEELVSRGYVIAAISHTLWTALTVFADGTTIKGIMNPSTLNSIFGTGSAQAAVWLADARFVLGEMTKANASDPLDELQGHLDLRRVGMFGHSFGGSTAIGLAATDARAKAAVNLDGSIFGAGSAYAGATPILLFMSDRQSDASWRPVFDGAIGPAFWLTLAKSGHFNFSDDGMVERGLGIPLDPTLGTIDPTRAVAIIEAYLDAFFDAELGGPKTSLLDGPSASFPEIKTFTKRP